MHWIELNKFPTGVYHNIIYSFWFDSSCLCVHLNLMWQMINIFMDFHPMVVVVVVVLSVYIFVCCGWMFMCVCFGILTEWRDFNIAKHFVQMTKWAQFKTNVCVCQYSYQKGINVVFVMSKSRNSSHYL